MIYNGNNKPRFPSSQKPHQSPISSSAHCTGSALLSLSADFPARTWPMDQKVCEPGGMHASIGRPVKVKCRCPAAAVHHCQDQSDGLEFGWEVKRHSAMTGVAASGSSAAETAAPMTFSSQVNTRHLLHCLCRQTHSNKFNYYR